MIQYTKKYGYFSRNLDNFQDSYFEFIQLYKKNLQNKVENIINENFIYITKTQKRGYFGNDKTIEFYKNNGSKNDKKLLYIFPKNYVYQDFKKSGQVDFNKNNLIVNDFEETFIKEINKKIESLKQFLVDNSLKTTRYSIEFEIYRFNNDGFSLSYDCDEDIDNKIRNNRELLGFSGFFTLVPILNFEIIETNSKFEKQINRIIEDENKYLSEIMNKFQKN